MPLAHFLGSIYFSKAQLQRCPSLFSHGKCRLSRTTVLTSGQIGGDRRARAVGRDLLHRGSRAIEAERDPVARAVKIPRPCTRNIRHGLPMSTSGHLTHRVVVFVADSSDVREADDFQDEALQLHDRQDGRQEEASARRAFSRRGAGARDQALPLRLPGAGHRQERAAALGAPPRALRAPARPMRSCAHLAHRAHVPPVRNARGARQPHTARRAHTDEYSAAERKEMDAMYVFPDDGSEL